MWLESLRKMKQKSGLTTAEIASGSGIPEPTLEKLFAGATKEPKLPTMKRLVYFLGYTLEDLYKEKAPSVSDEAMKIAKDYDDLDSWGQKAVRKVADVEMQRVSDSHVLRIAGRDGSYKEVRLTNEQLLKVIEQVNQLPDASDDL